MSQRILVAAEESALRARISGLLDDLGDRTDCTYVVTTVGSPVVAQYQASRTRFDLVILALQPSGSTLDLLLRLRDIYPSLPILLLRDATSYYPSQRLAQASIRSVNLSATNDTIQQVAADLLGVTLGDSLAPISQPVVPAWLALQPLRSDQRELVRKSVRQLERTPGVEFILVADRSGAAIASWTAHNQLDSAQMAVMAAATIATTVELSQQLGGQDSSSLIIKEIEEQTVLIARTEGDLVALIVLNKRAPLGWGRIIIKRLVEDLTTIMNRQAVVAYAS